MKNPVWIFVSFLLILLLLVIVFVTYVLNTAYSNPTGVIQAVNSKAPWNPGDVSIVVLLSIVAFIILVILVVWFPFRKKKLGKR